MKKFWETAEDGARIVVCCDAELPDGRAIGAARCIHKTTWGCSDKFMQRVVLEYVIQGLNFDIEQIAQKRGAK